MRVGRAALDEDAIRLIEANNPDLDFDWTRILKGQADPEPAAVPDRRDRRPDRERQQAKPSADGRTDRPFPSRSEPAVARTDSFAEAAPPDPLESQVTAEPSDPVAPEPMTAAHARLGFEGLVRLRARYGETMARITDRVPDPEQQSQLKMLAERLNPDAWVTDGDVSEGLESYERTFEALRGTIGHRRRNQRPDVAESE